MRVKAVWWRPLVALGVWASVVGGAWAQADAPAEMDAEQPAQAAEPSEESAVEYERLVREALQEYDLGHWEEARSLMLAAHELQPSARTLRGLGMVAFERRDYVDAADLLERALEDDRKPLTETQRAAVLELLDRTRHFLGRYRLDVKPQQPDDTRIFVDGAPAHLDRNGRVVLEAGEHELTVEAAEVGSRSLVVDVRGGEEVTLVVKLEGRKAEVVSLPAQAPATGEPERPFRGWGIGLGVTGVAVAAAGAVLGGVALGKAGSASSAHGPEADSARTLALAADIAIPAGCAAAVAGLSLWLVRREQRPTAAWQLSPVAQRRGGGLAVFGRF